MPHKPHKLLFEQANSNTQPGGQVTQGLIRCRSRLGMHSGGLLLTSRGKHTAAAAVHHHQRTGSQVGGPLQLRGHDATNAKYRTTQQRVVVLMLLPQARRGQPPDQIGYPHCRQHHLGERPASMGSPAIRVAIPSDSRSILGGSRGHHRYPPGPIQHPAANAVEQQQDAARVVRPLGRILLPRRGLAKPMLFPRSFISKSRPLRLRRRQSMCFTLLTLLKRSLGIMYALDLVPGAMT